MKNFSLTILLLLILFPTTYAQKTLKMKEIPSDIEGLLELRDRIADSPEGGATIFITAMIMYTNDKELGLQALTIALDRSELAEGHVYKGFMPYRSINYHLERLSKKPYMAKSYILGATPNNGYELPDGPYKLEFTRNRYSEQRNGDIKVFVKCTGAATPRPVTLRKNNRGVWKVKNYSSLVVDTVPPKNNTDDDL